ncbi:hypothetical protein TNCT_288881 [Trichonephila clavata]|uniref:Uncharacterized protein n=1 Tax=Trichonephila clavata TaxID=2740835 RepID=A0A8X6M1L9_TRICU|nr:hypothetical protein TNCT_288881 [Trichonephila clavata]
MSRFLAKRFRLFVELQKINDPLSERVPALPFTFEQQAKGTDCWRRLIITGAATRLERKLVNLGTEAETLWRLVKVEYYEPPETISSTSWLL